MNKSIRGAVDPISLMLVVLVVLGGGSLAGWRPMDMFKKKVPVEQLSQLQEERDAAVKAAEEAQAIAEATAKEEREKTDEHVRSGQQYVVGAAEAIASVPKESRTIDVEIAAAFLVDAQVRFAAAVGDLPRPQREEILRLWQQLRSSSQEEIDKAKQELDAKNAAFEALRAETDQLRVQLPIERERAAKANEEAQKAQTAVTAVTEEVKTWAQKTQDVMSERSSLVGSFKRLAFWAVGIWAFLAIGCPAIVKHLDSGNPVKALLRNVSGYVMNPLLHHDAKKKIQTIRQPPTLQGK